MSSPPGCELDLRTKAIRFFGCEDEKSNVNAVEKRLALVTSQRSGLTNKKRRALNREANILRRWLSPDARTSDWRSRLKGLKRSINNLKFSRRRKRTKRTVREARRTYREQHTHLQRRPDYTQKPVISMDELEHIRRLRDVQEAKKEAKRAWFERKHGREVNETACHGVATEETRVSAEMAHTVV
jgi:hypothetical protein